MTRQTKAPERRAITGLRLMAYVELGLGAAIPALVWLCTGKFGWAVAALAGYGLLLLVLVMIVAMIIGAREALHLALGRTHVRRSASRPDESS